MLVGIPAEHLAEAWPLVEPHLRRVVERTGERYSLEGIGKNIASRHWQLWAAVDPRSREIRAVAGSEIYSEVSGLKACNVLFASGLEAERWFGLLDGIEAWAKAQGCQRMMMMARKGWARRLPDYRMTHVVLEKEIA